MLPSSEQSAICRYPVPEEHTFPIRLSIIYFNIILQESV